MREIGLNEISVEETASLTSGRVLPLLLVMFIGSGCSALIYEIVWYQGLQLAIGSTSVSLGVLLSTFMGGLCIGSLFFPRLNVGDKHPLKIYAMIEIAIATAAHMDSAVQTRGVVTLVRRSTMA